MKPSSKWLLMAAAEIIQHAEGTNSAAGFAAVRGEQVNVDDVSGSLAADLDSLTQTIKLIADQEEVDISAAYRISGTPCA